MANSLKDQLLKAGVANKQQAQKADSQRRKNQKKKNKGEAVEGDKARQDAQVAQAEKLERDRALNRVRKIEAEKKAIVAQVIQLVEMNRLDRADADLAYNFVDGTKVCKLYVTQEMVSGLSRGQLSIVRYKQDYEVVPAVVAHKIEEREPDFVIHTDQTEEPSEQDDPYADYKVPDDLMW